MARAETTIISYKDKLDDKKYIYTSLTSRERRTGKQAAFNKFGPTELIFFKAQAHGPIQCHGETALPQQLSWLRSYFSIKTFKLQILFKTSRACQEET